MDDEDQRLRSEALQNAQAMRLEHERFDQAVGQERERLRITLSSIGDAVISTDAAGRVVFLNSVAETLTGWSQAEALGRPLTDIFKIVSQLSREPVENPALRALREGHSVALANHTMLVSRDGREWPIDDSASPMRDAAGTSIGAVLVFRDVSERKQAEEAQARLAAIVEFSDDLIISKSLEGIVRSWNGGAERLFGYTAEEMIGRSIEVLIPPERLDEEPQILRRLRSGERVDHFETVRVAKDGRRIDVSLTISPLRDQEGHLIGASKIGRDITRQKLAEAALRASEGRHRFLAELAAATQRLIDAQEVIDISARMLAEHLDVDRCVYAEVEDDSTVVVFGDHSRGVPRIVGRWPLGTFGVDLERALRDNRAFVVDDVDHDPRGGPALLAYRHNGIQAMICVPLHEGGRLAAVMAVHESVPRHWTSDEVELVRTVAARGWESIERTRAARGLKDSADRLALALAAARLGDWSWDASTDVVTFSPRAAEIFGIPAGPVMTWSAMKALVHPDDRERIVAAVDRALADGSQYDVEYRLDRGDGSLLWVSAKGRADFGADGVASGMFGVLQDVTDRVRLDQELQTRAEELASADRKKDDFIALLAHELRNPLAPVRTGLQIMRVAEDPAAVARARVIMDRQITHMVRLIDDLLDVSRLNRDKLHLQKSQVELADVIRDAVEAVMPSVEAAGHQLEVSLPELALIVEADTTRLAQVFGNLLSNSVKYTEAGGRIWLTARVEGATAIVEVGDTGVGIPAADLPGIFDMFAQVDRKLERTTGGLGIGLALVKALTTMHGGTVTAASAGTGQGSVFEVRLPLVGPAPQASPVSEPVAVRRGLRVLVVDDNVDGAEMMGELLAALGCQVDLAHDGLAAVETADRLHPDLILMDVGLPGMDGLEATRLIRSREWSRATTIVALTGWGQDDDRERSQAAGCNLHLVKPVSFEQLGQLLRDLEQKLAPG
jgi:PAS domain S-box-containing protein